MKITLHNVNYRRAVFLVCSALTLLAVATAQKSCFTPFDTYGHCVPYTECRYITDIFNQYGSNIPQYYVDVLRRSQCVGKTQEIHICCDSSETTLASIATTPESTDISGYESSLYERGLAILRAQKCGSSKGNRVAFGEDADIGEFPWMALLRYDTSQHPFQCGGSVITNRYVLTAAHCVVNVPDTVIGVRLGEYDLSKELDCQGSGRRRRCLPPVEDYGIEKITAHPSYSKAYRVNDVALIKLDREVEFDKLSHIKPICLPITERAAKLDINHMFFIAGWGFTEEGSTASVLQIARIAFKSRQVCQKIFTRTRITDTHICAGGDGRIDSCKGDSGGPLFSLAPYNTTQRNVQYGIVSFGGVQCGGTKTYPGIYSNVITLMPWITSNIV